MAAGGWLPRLLTWRAGTPQAQRLVRRRRHKHIPDQRQVIHLQSSSEQRSQISYQRSKAMAITAPAATSNAHAHTLPHCHRRCHLLCCLVAHPVCVPHVSMQQGWLRLGRRIPAACHASKRWQAAQRCVLCVRGGGGGDGGECQCKGTSVHGGTTCEGAVQCSAVQCSAVQCSAVQCCLCTTAAAPGDGRVAGASPKPTLVRRERQCVDSRTVLHWNAAQAVVRRRLGGKTQQERKAPRPLPARSPRRPRCGGRGRRRGG